MTARSAITVSRLVRVASLAALLVVLSGAGCMDAQDGSGSGGAADPVVRDSAGVVLVDLPEDRSHLPLLEARLDDATTLSGDFHLVTGGAVFSDGWMAVGNAGSREIWYFDPSGTRQIVVGGPGQGPGEFQGINGVHRWPGDSVVVFDVGLRRHTLLGPRGELVRTFAFAVSEAVPFAQLRGVLSDGGMVGTGFSRLPEGGPTTGRHRYPSPVFTFAPEGARPVVTGLESWGEGYFEATETFFRVTVPPFAQSLQILAAGSRVALASTETGEVRIHAPDGTLERVVRGVGVPRAVSPASHLAEVERLMQNGLADDDPAERRAFLMGIEVGAAPRMGQVRADVDGRLWVEPWVMPGEGSGGDPGEGQDWTVLDVDGLPVARAQLPRGFRPLEIGEDHLLGVLPDALGVEQVIRLVLR